MNRQPRWLIVGAGLSGLALAFELKCLQAKIDLTIIESANRAGGKIWTEEQEGFRFEWGPNGFLDSKPSTIDLCKKLGIDGALIPASEGARKYRYVHWRDTIQVLPNSLFSFLNSPLLSWRSKWRLLTEKYRHSVATSNDESVYEFAVRRTNKEIADLFADLMVTGIHAGDPKQLSVKAAFPRLYRWEKDFGSVMRGMNMNRQLRRKEARRQQTKLEPVRMWSFPTGLRFLVDQLTEKLASSIQFGQIIQKIEKISPSAVAMKDSNSANYSDTEKKQPAPENPTYRVEFSDGREQFFDGVVLTCPSYIQADLLLSLDLELAKKLQEIVYNAIVVVVTGYDRGSIGSSFDGFGFISPQAQGGNILGTQWCSSIFTDRAPSGCVLYRTLCGGVARPEIIEWSDEKLLETVHQELARLMQIKEKPRFARIIRWPKAIPQYLLGHTQRNQQIQNLLKRHHNFYLSGNAFQGVAMNDCTENALTLAKQIEQDLLGQTNN